MSRTMSLKSRFIRSMLATLGVLAGILAASASRQDWSTLTREPTRTRAWEKIAPRLKQADAHSAADAENHVKSISAFFDERRQGVRGFAEDLLSLRGKWAYARSFVDDKSHQAYIAECFERHVFRGDELKAAVEAAVAAYVGKLQGQENQLLVDIRADLSDDASTTQEIPELAADETLRRRYQAMLEEVVPILERDLGVTVGREIVSLIGSEIATQIVIELGTTLATRLGLSAGLLGAGASSGWATFGIGLVVGYLVDQILDWAFRLGGYDPEGEIAAKVQATLAHLEQSLIEGDPEVLVKYRELQTLESQDPFAAVRDASRKAADVLALSGKMGLRGELIGIHRTRSRLRETALKTLILQGGTP